MNPNTAHKLQEVFKALDRGPENPDRQYIHGGATVGEVYGLAERLHGYLQENCSGEIICLATDDKAMMAAAILVSLAGGSSFLLPYALSPKALTKMREEVGFGFVLGPQDCTVPGGVNRVSPDLFKEGSEVPLPSFAPGREVVKIYTGGSTGSPQIWSKTGTNLFGEAMYLASKFKVTEKDCILATVPPLHIYGLLFSVILPLVSGARVVAQVPSFPGEITEAVRNHGATLLVSVPAHYRVLADTSLGLRMAFSSAGMLAQEDNEAFSRANRAGVTEIYGSTETGGIATRNRLAGEEFFTAFTTIDWKIVKDCLAVHSPYISQGLTVDEDGYYRSGDRIEIEKDGTFSLLGRADHITKVGGKRVDLEEIRGLIIKEKGVVDCVVVVMPQAGGREHRIEIVVQGNTPDLEVVREHLADHLEPYAMPRGMKVVEHIPMKTNGKYDWDAIREILS